MGLAPMSSRCDAHASRMRYASTAAAGFMPTNASKTLGRLSMSIVSSSHAAWKVW